MIRYVIRLVDHDTMYYAGYIEQPCKCFTTAMHLATLFTTKETAYPIREYLISKLPNYKSILIDRVRIKEIDIDVDTDW